MVSSNNMYHLEFNETLGIFYTLLNDQAILFQTN